MRNGKYVPSRHASRWEWGRGAHGGHDELPGGRDEGHKDLHDVQHERRGLLREEGHRLQEVVVHEEEHVLAQLRGEALEAAVVGAQQVLGGHVGVVIFHAALQRRGEAVRAHERVRRLRDHIETAWEGTRTHAYMHGHVRMYVRITCR